MTRMMRPYTPAAAAAVFIAAVGAAARSLPDGGSDRGTTALVETSEFAELLGVRKGGEINNSQRERGRRLASCEYIEITGGNFPSAYAQDGERNGAGLYYNAARTGMLWYRERIEEDDDGNNRRRNLAEQRQGSLDRQLGACTGGYWTNGPTGGGYPQLVVSDCASHPADIKVQEWFEITCAECNEVSYGDQDPVVSCLDDVPSSLTSGSSSQTDDDDDDEDDDDDDSSVITVTPSPASSGSGSETGCSVLDVGGKYADLYEKVSTYNGRGDYYSSDQAHNIFFERIEVSQTAAMNAARGGNRRQRMLREAMTGANDRAVVDAHGSRSRELAACDTGYWIITPTGGGYPFYAVSDCAVNPEDIDSSVAWLIVLCDTCNAEPASVSQDIKCATGADAFVETPAPVPPIQTGLADSPSLPGGGSTSCEDVTVTGAEAGAYTVVGEVNGRADLRRDDELFRFYWSDPAPALENRRRSLVAESGEREGADRALTDCEGWWYINPIAALYPAYAVNDCAGHPADITSTDWVLLTCETCEVETVEPTPGVSCTGAGENIKRGAPNLDTPAPTPYVVNATEAPHSAVVTVCETVVLTGEFSGNYTANGTYKGKLDFYSWDGLHNLYFERVVRRQRDRALSWMGWSKDGEIVEDDFKETRTLPGSGIHDAMVEAMNSVESLAACTSGYWIIAPISGDGYPVFGVADCADHPVDIRGSTWMVETCESCGVQDAPSFVGPTIECGEDPISSRGAAGGSISPTPAPAAPSNCGQVYVMGPAAGVYGQRGTYNGKVDFANTYYQLYWVFYAGKPVNRRGRYRHRQRNRRNLVEAPEDEAPGEWVEEHALALENLAMDYRQQIEEAAGGWEVDAASRKLEYCEDGFWLITPRGGGFPFYGTKNCADHPADVGATAVWNVVDCDGCGSQSMNDTVTISCDSEGYVAPPTPVGVPTPTPAFLSTSSPDGTFQNGTLNAISSSSGVHRIIPGGGVIFMAVASVLVMVAAVPVLV